VTIVSIALCALVLGSCGGSVRPALSQGELEAELIGRVVEAKGLRSYSMVRGLRHNPLSHGVHYVQYKLDSSGNDGSIAVTCYDAYVSRHGDLRPARCELDGSLGVDLSAPSRIAAELVAITEPLRTSLRCKDGLSSITRAEEPHGAVLTVRGCGKKLAFHVSCDTDDPVEAPRRCRVEQRAPRVEFDTTAHPGVTLHHCPDGEGLGVLVPNGRLLTGKETISWMEAHAAQLIASGSGTIKELGFGLCCSTRGALPAAVGWCVRAYVDARGDPDAPVSAVADAVMAIPGERPRVFVTYYFERAPL
jgi:hypothetical protein